MSWAAAMREAVVPALVEASCHIAQSEMKLTVVPAQAGTQRLFPTLDSRLRGNDGAVKTFGSSRKTLVGRKSAAPSDIRHDAETPMRRMAPSAYPTYPKSRPQRSSSGTLATNSRLTCFSRMLTRTAILQAALQAGASR